MKNILYLFIFLYISLSYSDDFYKPISKNLFDIKHIWGSIVISYKMDDTNKFSFKDKNNNAFSIASTFGYFYTFTHQLGIGFEVAGWSDLGLNIANSPRINDQIFPNVTQTWLKLNDSELSQLFISYKTDSFAIRIGREEINHKISPWLFSERSISVLDFAYDGLILSYKQNQNLYNFGWITNISNISQHIKLGENGFGTMFISSQIKPNRYSKLHTALYIFPKSKYTFHNIKLGDNENLWSAWLYGSYKFHGFNNVLQIVYCDGNHDKTKTIAIANQLRIYRKKYTLKATLAYINDGEYSIKSAGLGIGSSAFLGKSLNGEFGSDIKGYKQYITRVDAQYKLNNSKVYGGLAYNKHRSIKLYQLNKEYAIQLGYMLNYNHIHYQVEYRYKHQQRNNHTKYIKQHLHFDIIYKFIK